MENSKFAKQAGRAQGSAGAGAQRVRGSVRGAAISGVRKMTNKKDALEYVKMNLEACRKEKEVLVQKAYAEGATHEQKHILFSEIDQLSGSIRAYVIAWRVIEEIQEEGQPSPSSPPAGMPRCTCSVDDIGGRMVKSEECFYHGNQSKTGGV